MQLNSRTQATTVVAVCLIVCTGLLMALAPADAQRGPAITTLLFSGVVAALGAYGIARMVGASPIRSHVSAVIISAFLSAGIAIRAGLDLQTTTALSQSLMRPAPELGPGGKALIPHLVNAESVVPDRPHHPDDVNASDRFDRFTRLRTFQASTNGLGLRGPAFETPAPAFRILCIGDSVTFGWGVADVETYPAHLGRLLNIEVLNAGMPASKPSHMAKWLQINARAVDADLVILAARPHWAAPKPFEDYRNAVLAAESAIAPAQLVIVLPPVSTFDPMGVRDKDKEVQGLKSVLGNRPFLELTPAFWRAQSGTGVIMEMENGMHRMVMLPTRDVVAEGRAKNDRLADELVQAFENDHSLVEPLFFDGGHPDKHGYALFAREVAAFLRKHQLIAN